VGTPVVGLFGPTTREWGFYPDPEEGMVLEREGEDCRPCSRHGGATCERERACLELITTEDVMAAVETYL
jgi:ADP-heptose:LPS heptosyltransferase